MFTFVILIANVFKINNNWHHASTYRCQCAHTFDIPITDKYEKSDLLIQIFSPAIFLSQPTLFTHGMSLVTDTISLVVVITCACIHVIGITENNITGCILPITHPYLLTNSC